MRKVTPTILGSLLGICTPPESSTLSYRDTTLFVNKVPFDLVRLADLLNQYIQFPEVPTQHEG
jgi:hypothetical protein